MAFFAGILQISLAVAVVTGYLIPVLLGTNQTSWSPGMIALWALGGIICVAGVLNGLANLFGFGF